MGVGWVCLERELELPLADSLRYGPRLHHTAVGAPHPHPMVSSSAQPHGVIPPGDGDTARLVVVEEQLEDVGLLLLEDDIPVLKVPVEDVAGLGGDGEAAVLGDQGVGNDGAQGRVGQGELQLARHEVPDPDAAPGDDHGDASLGGDAGDGEAGCGQPPLPDGVNGQAVLVNVALFLKNVIKVPDFDASIDRRRDHAVVCPNDEGLDLDDPLEVGHHPLHEVAGLHVPAEQLLPGTGLMIRHLAHLIPVTASLSPLEMMMLLLWLNLMA